MQSMYTIQLSPTHLAILDCWKNTDGYYIVTRINVPKEFRGCGSGTKLLKMFLDDADKEGVDIVLWVLESDGLSSDELTKWYKRHGFVDFRDQLLIRRPNQSKVMECSTFGF